MRTALLCDDDDVLRRVVRAVLEEAGWEVLDEAERAIDDELRSSGADAAVAKSEIGAVPTLLLGLSSASA